MNGGLAAPPLAREGEVRTLPGLAITILRMGPEGITRVKFDFARELTHPAYRFMAWRGGVLENVEIPAVGETIVVNRATPGRVSTLAPVASAPVPTTAPVFVHEHVEGTALGLAPILSRAPLAVWLRQRSAVT